jgi:hypothetical protein
MNTGIVKTEWVAALEAGAIVLFDFSFGLFVGSHIPYEPTTWYGLWGTKEEFIHCHVIKNQT